MYFNDIVKKALYPATVEGGPVVKIYLNVEKCYAFVEFASIELTTACMQLDGIKFVHHTGTTIIRVRRPNDYRPELLPPSNNPIPQLNLDVLGSIGATVTNGPGKIFIGGLPYNLADEQIMELLGAFGPIRQFHQVRDPGSATSKGYAFCEYADPATAEAAILGLNGLKIGEKTLSVRIAVATAATANNMQQLMMQQPPQQQSQYGLSLGGIPAATPSMPSGYNSMDMGHNSGFGGFPPGLGAPTRVLRLSNVASHEELQDDREYNEIVEDIRLECCDHGKVLGVLAPRIKDGYPNNLEGYIYVEFATSQMAQSAAAALNGRKFGDKIVAVQYFDETKFANGVYL